MVFCGGMPRASYGERHTVTVIQDTKHVVFDLSSKVVDFVVLPSVTGGSFMFEIIMDKK